jgi:hypothetical protein
MAKVQKHHSSLMQLKEWVNSVASAAGVSPGDARLATGQIGSRESLLELEILFFSLAARSHRRARHTSFRCCIPAENHCKVNNHCNDP